MAKKKQSNYDSPPDAPVFCDFSCKYADFSEPDSIGACRKELAVWCKHFKRYNNKHNKCFGAK